MLKRLAGVLVGALAIHRVGGLQMQLWHNAGQGGDPEISTVPSLSALTWSADLHNETFSALILGLEIHLRPTSQHPLA